MTAIALERRTDRYWRLIRHANRDVKAALITRLGASLLPSVSNTKRSTERPMAADFAGIWSDDDYMDADELVKTITDLRHTKNREPVSL